MTRRILVWILIAALNCNAIAWASGPQSPQADAAVTYKQALTGLDRANSLSSRLRTQINRSAFDLEAVLEKTEYEAKTIISFVKQQIAFEQYVGLLRGAQGTLMSRAGNSLDQSVLLNSMSSP